MHNSSAAQTTGWEVNLNAFTQWISHREELLTPALPSEPCMKVLIFLALVDANKECNYDDLREILKSKEIVRGTIPYITMRSAITNLAKTLDEAQHPLELISLRAKFQLVSRTSKSTLKLCSKKQHEPVILLMELPSIKAEDIACDLIEKAELPFHALYFLEWSARWWEIFSSKEAQIRVQYESEAWEKLGIKDRILKNPNDTVGIVGLGPGEGIAEIELLKKILRDNKNKKVHYLAIDSSQRLLRGHINLLKETLATEIENGRLLCAGVVGDIFSGLREIVSRVRSEFIKSSITKSECDFLPPTCGLLVTYFGNCLGNNSQDQETEIFSNIYSTFQNRPLEFLVGVSVMRASPDEYKRNWDDFLLQTPKHLLETKKLLISSQPADSQDLPEFNLPPTGNSKRCPPVIPESYIVRHQIKGQIYRFYYKLAYDLKLSSALYDLRPLPRGTLILLYNIIKYNMETLVAGIEKCGLFKVKYDKNYHQMVDTPNGKREYAVFSAYSEK